MRQRNDHWLTGVQKLFNSDLIQVRFHAFDLLLVSERKQSSTFAFIPKSLTVCLPVFKKQKSKKWGKVFGIDSDRASSQR